MIAAPNLSISTSGLRATLPLQHPPLFFFWERQTASTSIMFNVGVEAQLLYLLAAQASTFFNKGPQLQRSGSVTPQDIFNKTRAGTKQGAKRAA